jgi:formamidopyrimidine-DNA glycosylase
MPEGHTIHRAALELRELFAGSRIRARSPQGRFDAGAALIDGRRLVDVEAWGKHLFYDFGDEMFVHVHLGLFGRLRRGRQPAPPIRGAVRLLLESDTAWSTLSGATVCEVIDAAGRKRVLSRLGPDPLRSASRPADAFARISRSATPIGVLVMDQSVIAGIGNVYRAELLFRSGILPQRPGTTIEAAEFASFWRDARRMLRNGVEEQTIVTTRPSDRPHPKGKVRRAERFYAYHRTNQPCWVCGTPIRAAAMAARTVYWCPVCQR